MKLNSVSDSGRVKKLLAAGPVSSICCTDGRDPVCCSTAVLAVSMLKARLVRLCSLGKAAARSCVHTSVV
jgi:hypothetical protein